MIEIRNSCINRSIDLPSTTLHSVTPIKPSRRPIIAYRSGGVKRAFYPVECRGASGFRNPSWWAAHRSRLVDTMTRSRARNRTNLIFTNGNGSAEDGWMDGSTSQSLGCRSGGRINIPMYIYIFFSFFFLQTFTLAYVTEFFSSFSPFHRYRCIYELFKYYTYPYRYIRIEIPQRRCVQKRGEMRRRG